MCSSQRLCGLWTEEHRHVSFQVWFRDLWNPQNKIRSACFLGCSFLKGWQFWTVEYGHPIWVLSFESFGGLRIEADRHTSGAWILQVFFEKFRQKKKHVADACSFGYSEEPSKKEKEGQTSMNLVAIWMLLRKPWLRIWRPLNRLKSQGLRRANITSLIVVTKLWKFWAEKNSCLRVFEPFEYLRAYKNKEPKTDRHSRWRVQFEVI